MLSSWEHSDLNLNSNALQRGGRTIYAGPLGKDSSDLVAYFSAIPNVPPIATGINPATWMLEVSTPGMEERLGVNFADIYQQSGVYQCVPLNHQAPSIFLRSSVLL